VDVGTSYGVSQGYGFEVMMSIFNAGRNALGISTVPNPEHPTLGSCNSRRGKSLLILEI
jgi:Na+-translocating ferredoxin:NAD+ oxidoreductase RnfA subunit